MSSSNRQTQAAFAAYSAQRPDQEESGRERVLRRQTELGGHSAGSSRTARLDPHALPVRFTAEDAVADERLRHVELHRERVILRRAVQGMRIALNVPGVTFSAGLKVQFNTTQQAVNQTFDVGGTPLLLQVDAGPFVRVAAKNLDLNVVGQTLHGASAYARASGSAF